MSRPPLIKRGRMTQGSTAKQPPLAHGEEGMSLGVNFQLCEGQKCNQEVAIAICQKQIML